MFKASSESIVRSLKRVAADSFVRRHFLVLGDDANDPLRNSFSLMRAHHKRPRRVISTLNFCRSMSSRSGGYNYNLPPQSSASWRCYGAFCAVRRIPGN